MISSLSTWWGLSGFAAVMLGAFSTSALAVETPGSLGKQAPVLNQRPLDVYVATGKPDACGPGCSEWIAIDGRFDAEAGKRFRDFMNASPKRRTLPVFFHSPGGVLSSAIEIALVLRENQMTAGVGRTSQAGCTVQRVAGGNCDMQVKSGNDVPSEFSFEGSQCHSACVYAIAGGTNRKISPAARVGIHSPKVDELAWKQFTEQHPGARRLTDEERGQGLSRFMMALGVDPAIVDAASKISHNTMYILKREEILRYGLETSDRFETGWMMRSNQDGSAYLVKIVTEGQDRATAIAQFSCSDLFGYRFALFRGMPKDQYAVPPPAQLTAGEKRFSLLPAGVKNAVAIWTAVARTDEAQNIAAAPQIDIGVVYARGPETAVAMKMSTTGLAAGLTELQNHCSQRKLNASTGKSPAD